MFAGRHPPSTPPSKRLLTDANSNIFIYLTGHGGDEFLKFQDAEEISAFDLADAVAGMHAAGRYRQLLFMADTCQANTLYSRFYSPGVLATGSSGKGENSYSHHADQDVGVAVTDRYTHHVLTFLEGVNKTSDVTLQNLFDTFSYEIMHSNAGVRSDLFGRDAAGVRVTEFFGGVSPVEVVGREGGAVGAGEEECASRDGYVAVNGAEVEEGLQVARPSARRRRGGMADAEGGPTTQGGQAEAGRSAGAAGWVVAAVLVGLQLAGLGGWALSGAPVEVRDELPGAGGESETEGHKARGPGPGTQSAPGAADGLRVRVRSRSGSI